MVLFINFKNMKTKTSEFTVNPLGLKKFPKKAKTIEGQFQINFTTLPETDEIIIEFFAWAAVLLIVSLLVYFLI